MNNTFGTYKKSAFLVVCFALASLFFSCSAKGDKSKDAVSRQNEIEEYSKKVNDNPTILTQVVADTLLSLYGDYVRDFPQDTMSEYYLFQMSNVYQALDKCDSALYCLDRIIKEYPNGRKVGAAYFFKGVVLNDVCMNKQESIKAFEVYIEKFPNSKHVQTAKKMIMMDTMNNPLDLINKQ